MSYKLQVLRDNPMAFWLLDETSVSTGQDSSPYGNLATYVGNIDSSNLPIVVDGINSKLINIDSYITYSVSNDYIQTNLATGFATKETSDNDFSLECWFKPSLSNSNLFTPIFADSNSNIGIFWNNGNVVFSTQSQKIVYPVVNSDRAIHVVGVYSNSSMSLYVDSILIGQIYYENNIFTNSSNSFSSGPTLLVQDKFLIDSAAVYRYSLSQDQIKNHYILAQSIPAIQIASPDNGQLFQIYDNGISRQFEYSYPANKGWDKFNNNNLFYNVYDKSLSVAATDSASVDYSISDLITVPLGFDLNSSKIEWEGTEGISVYVSVDNITFIKCINGSSIPKYKFGSDSFDQSRKVYLSIRFKSSDTSKYLPKINNLSILFYNNKKIFALNGGAYISSLSGQQDSSDISFGRSLSPILFRGFNNGLFCRQESGFSLNTGKLIKTIEFFYTPKLITFLEWSSIVDIASSNLDIIDSEVNSIFASDIIVEAETSNPTSQNGNIIYSNNGDIRYSWGTDGSIDKSGISAIFVNGVDKTSETDISNVIRPGQLHHIIITLVDSAIDEIKFNYSPSGAVESLYQNIIIYESEFSTQKSQEHFGLWVGKNSASASDSSMSMTENSALTYGNDWVVIQTV